MRHFTSIRPVLLLFATTALFGCGGGGGGVTGTPTPPPPPPPPGTPNSVVVTAGSFTPSDLSVTAGSTVTWTWNSCSGGDVYGSGQTCVTHDVVFNDGSAASGALSEGTYSRTFTTPGTYAYHCAIHGASMSGTVVVK